MPTRTVNRVTPNQRTYTLEGRLGRVLVRGARLKGDVAARVLTGTLDLTTGQSDQLTLGIYDPDLELLDSGLFVPGGARRKGSPLDYGDLRLEVAAVEVTGTTLTVTARSLGTQKLRRARGALVRKNLSPTRFAEQLTRAEGLRFVGEPSAARTRVTRRHGKDAETSWATLQRLAKELGYLCFETAGTVYFGRPSWLADRANRELRIAWADEDTDPRIITPPTCRRTGDDPRRVATVDVAVTGTLGDDVLPGHRFTLDGIPTFDGRYLIDRVNIPLDDTTPVAISASTARNPKPEPPDADSRDARTGRVSVPRPRRSLTVKGAPATRDQLSNAVTIYKVGRAMSIPARGIRVAITTAITESVLRNLDHGDRDSLGLFQQRATWGSRAERMDPDRSARLFYRALKRVPGWESLTIAAACQQVQRSAYPSAYAKWDGEAGEIVSAIIATIPRDSGRDSDSGSRRGGRGTAGEFVRVALAQAGDSYIFGAETRASDPDPDAFDCSELVEWALARVGVKFVDGSANQLAAVHRIPVERAIRTRGALLFHPGHVAISLGNGRTIEAASRRYGVRSFSAAGRFTAAGLIPGLRY